MAQNTISNKKVLLVTNASVLSQEMILHGLNLSKRMDASLEILHLLKKVTVAAAAQSFKSHLAKLHSTEPVAYIPLLNDRGLTTETVEYARNRRNIFCIILCLKGEGAPQKKGQRQKKFAEVTQLLNCPVVLYTESPVS
ncbi:MAG: hypothetical protein PF442_11505 [Desulfobulbaceae bacterium]|nr:hypothetical protein [Desulfobulbaceae bacterium]